MNIKNNIHTTWCPKNTFTSKSGKPTLKSHSCHRCCVHTRNWSWDNLTLQTLPMRFLFSFLFQWLQGFPGGSAGKGSACNVGDLGLIPGLGRSPGEGNSYPLQYSGLENPVDCVVHGAAESDSTEWLPFSLTVPTNI